MSTSSTKKAYILTGPTSGIGYRTALYLAAHGTVVLVGRNKDKLEKVKTEIESVPGQSAVYVICDFSDLNSVRNAVREIVGLNIAWAGIHNNAGVMVTDKGQTKDGIDVTFVTNHLAPFLFVSLLIPHLPDGANIVFTAAGAEDPDRKAATMAGFRGGRFISVDSCVKGELVPGGASSYGMDAYATSKQCILASTFELARENERLNVNAFEPGFIPTTAIMRDAGFFMRFLLKYVLVLMVPFMQYWGTESHAGRMATDAVVNEKKRTGVYIDDLGGEMQPSIKVQDPKFCKLVVKQTREYLDKINMLEPL